MEPDNQPVSRNWKVVRIGPVRVRMGLAALIIVVIACASFALAREPIITFAKSIVSSFDDYAGFITGIKNGFTTISVLLFLALIGVLKLGAWNRSRSSAAEIPLSKPITTRYLLRFMTPLLLIFCAAASLNIYVNPRGMYNTNYYLPWGVDARETKTNLYDALPGTPEVVILGSSRAFTIAPQYIRQKLGYDAFNLSVEGGLINDSLMLTRYMSEQGDHTLPKVLLVESEFSFDVTDAYTASASPLRLIPFMETSTAALALRTRLEAAVDVQQVAESLWVMKFVATYKVQPKGYSIESDGLTLATFKITDLNAQIAPQIQTGIPAVCAPYPSAGGESALIDLIQLAAQHKTAVIFYRSPFHPKYYDAMVRAIPTLESCYHKQLTYLETIAQRYDNVFVLDFALLKSINGVDTVEGYYDYMHLTRLNGERLVDAAAETIQRAYAWATAKRGTNF